MAFTVSHHPSAQKCSTKEKRSRLLISLGHKGSSVTYKWSDTCSKLKVKGKGEGRGGGRVMLSSTKETAVKRCFFWN